METKTITRKYNKWHYKRNVMVNSEIPGFAEIEIFLDKMFKKGYIPLEKSLTIRNTALPHNTPHYRIWGWFVYTGKHSYELIGQAVSECISDEGREFLLKNPRSKESKIKLMEMYEFSSVWKERTE